MEVDRFSCDVCMVCYWNKDLSASRLFNRSGVLFYLPHFGGEGGGGQHGIKMDTIRSKVL